MLRDHHRFIRYAAILCFFVTNLALIATILKLRIDLFDPDDILLTVISVGVHGMILGGVGMSIGAIAGVAVRLLLGIGARSHAVVFPVFISVVVSGFLGLSFGQMIAAICGG